MNRPLPALPAADLEHILAHTAPLWRELAGSRIFITGGTGFFGKWILESIAAANDALGANTCVTVLSRDPHRFAKELPHLAGRPAFSLLKGDAVDFDFPDGHFDHVFHFATASAEEVGAGGTATIMHTLRGTERVLQFAMSAGANRLLFASSGAVYGRQPKEFGYIPEDYHGAPDPTDPASAYGEMKRISEAMCVSSGVGCVIARGFAFVGPHLPLTDKFAVGSFIRDALAGGPIRIHGDGTPLRSYLYAADLAIWLLAIMVRGRNAEAYNIGSDQAISIAELAQRIVHTADHSMSIEIGHQATRQPPERYVPSTKKSRSELGLATIVPLDLALKRTIDWARGVNTTGHSSRDCYCNSSRPQ